jgi:hypothetical protein
MAHGPQGAIATRDVVSQELNNRGLVFEYDQYVLPPQGTARSYLTCGLHASVREGVAHFTFRPTGDRPNQQVLAYGVVLNVTAPILIGGRR